VDYARAAFPKYAQHTPTRTSKKQRRVRHFKSAALDHDTSRRRAVPASRQLELQQHGAHEKKSRATGPRGRIKVVDADRGRAQERDQAGALVVAGLACLFGSLGSLGVIGRSGSCADSCSVRSKIGRSAAVTSAAR